MLARRVIAISPDKAIAKRLGAGLMAAGGSAEVVSSLDALSNGEIQAALVVVHFADANVDILRQVHARLKKDAWMLAVVPTSDLRVLVAAMLESDRVAGIMVADEMTTPALAAMSSRILYGDIFGLEKVVPWGTRVYSSLVGDYQEKSVCISQISDHAGTMGVRRKYREAIEQVTDELLMNALYDAPVDQAGNQLFADVPTKTRISLRMEQKAVVQYAGDSETFTISVRDSFGTLQRGTVLQYLHKCLYAEQQIDRKTGGAGLGLYIMANTTTQLLFNLLPGVATEVVCTFDLRAPKVVLKKFGFFHEKIDATGRLVAGTSQLHPKGAMPAFPVERRHDAHASNKGLVASLLAAIILLVALIGVVAYPRLIDPATGAIAITTMPPGATVEIDGSSRGVATDGRLVVEGLRAGTRYRVVAQREGYESAEATVAPVAGQQVSVDLALAPRQTTAYVDSDPSGATVLFDGQELGTTPLTVTTLPPSSEVELEFRKMGYLDVTRSLRMPRQGGEATLATALTLLPDFGSVALSSTPSGAQVYQNGELLAGVVTPVGELIVQAGKQYRFTLEAPGHMPVTVQASIQPGDRGVPLSATLTPGGSISVAANIEGRASVRGVEGCQEVELPLRGCPVPNGEYQVEIEAERPWASAGIPVVVEGNAAKLTVEFGFVEAGPGYDLEIRRGRLVDRIALPEGMRKVDIVSKTTGELEKLAVKIVAGKTITVP